MISVAPVTASFLMLSLLLPTVWRVQARFIQASQQVLRANAVRRADSAQIFTTCATRFHCPPKCSCLKSGKCANATHIKQGLANCGLDLIVSNCSDVVFNEAFLQCKVKRKPLKLCAESRNGTAPCLERRCSTTKLLSGIGSPTISSSGKCLCRCCNGQMPVCDPGMHVVGSGGVSVISVQCKCVGISSETENDGQDQISDETSVQSPQQSTPSKQQAPTPAQNEQQTTSSDASEGSDGAQTPTSTASPPPDCVETQWLTQNGFEKDLLEKMGSAYVVCPHHFPCGTPGHMVRRCNEKARCSLVSYAHICREDNACIQRLMHVSRLKHSFDWSLVRRFGDDGSWIELTSVSVDTNSPPFSLSYGIAYLGHYLSSHGYGHMCDYMVKGIRRMRRAIC